MEQQRDELDQAIAELDEMIAQNAETLTKLRLTAA